MAKPVMESPVMPASYEDAACSVPKVAEAVEEQAGREAFDEGPEVFLCENSGDLKTDTGGIPE